MKSTKMRLVAVCTAAVAMSGVLSACGGGGSTSSSSSYCSDLKKAKSDLTSLSDSSASAATNLVKVFAAFDTLSAEAPGAVKSDWATLEGAAKTIEKGFADAGLKLSDFTKIQQGQMPSGVDTTKLSKLATTFQSINNATFAKASDNIAAHAKKTCKIDLSGT